MVSLEKKINYLSRITESPKLNEFNNLLSKKPILIPQGQDLSESDEIYFGIVNAIQINSKVDFEKYYNKKNKSKPSKDSPSPFVNDDFLIFSLIVGIVKFEIDKSWINHIISIRNRNEITITFESILNENYYNTSNLPEIVLMFFNLNNHSLITNSFVNLVFEKINENTTLFESRNDFQIICTIKAYDFIILRKEIAEGNEISLLGQFNENFKKRIKFLSWIVQSAILFGLIYGFLNLPKYTPEVIVLIDKYNYIFTLLGALGITFFSNLIPFIRNKSQKILMMLLGYPKGLLNNKEENK